MVSEIKLPDPPSVNLRFLYPFRGQDVLWETINRNGNKWHCRALDKKLNGQEAVFDDQLVKACIVLDNLSIKIDRQSNNRMFSHHGTAMGNPVQKTHSNK